MGISSNKKDLNLKDSKMIKIKEIKSNTNIWKSIKYSYNLKEIFTFINTKQKINIIIYNKQI